MNRLKALIDDMYLPRPPFWLIAAALVLVPATWLPLAFIAKARVTVSPQPPINIFQGMDDTPRYNTQSTNPVFADNRSMRPAPAGTVARGGLISDPHFELGYAIDGNQRPMTVDGPEGTKVAQFFSGYPSSVTVDMKLLRRGRERYNIYCAPCHGLDGLGYGMINNRALTLQQAGASATTWTQASNMHAVDPNTGELTYGEPAYPNGKLFNTITNGIRNMPAYGNQVPPADRWAIVAYVRALQINQGSIEREEPAETAPTEAAPPDAEQNATN
jgi:mono/diheme cytochrome c family protein